MCISVHPFQFLYPFFWSHRQRADLRRIIFFVFNVSMLEVLILFLSSTLIYNYNCLRFRVLWAVWNLLVQGMHCFWTYARNPMLYVHIVDTFLVLCTKLQRFLLEKLLILMKMAGFNENGSFLQHPVFLLLSIQSNIPILWVKQTNPQYFSSPLTKTNVNI